MINTNLIQTTRFRHAGDEEKRREQLKKSYQRRNYGPEKVAQGILKAIQENQRTALISPESKIMYYMERYCPTLSRYIARRAFKQLFYNDNERSG